MALTTRISSSSSFFPAPWCQGESIGTWYGYAVPVGVAHIYESQDMKTLRISMNWRTKDGTIHTMPYDPSVPGQIEAVIVAMKLSC